MKELREKLKQIKFKKMSEEIEKIINNAETFFINPYAKTILVRTENWENKIELNAETTENYFEVFKDLISEFAKIEIQCLEILSDLKLKSDKRNLYVYEEIMQKLEKNKNIYVERSTDTIYYENMVFDFCYNSEEGKFEFVFNSDYNFDEVEEYVKGEMKNVK